MQPIIKLTPCFNWSSVLQMGQTFSICTTFVQQCPRTSCRTANGRILLWHRSNSIAACYMRHTSHTSVAAASLSLSSSDAIWNASVWAPRLWPIDLRNCRLEYIRTVVDRHMLCSERQGCSSFLHAKSKYHDGCTL